MALAVSFVALNGYFYGLTVSCGVAWLIGIYILGWCSYTDLRVCIAPERWLVAMLFVPFIAAIGEIKSAGIFDILAPIFSAAMAMSTTAGIVWIARAVVSGILQKEALGEGDIYPCAMVGGILGVAPGVAAFLYAPFVMIVFILYDCIRGVSLMRPRPLLPAIMAVTLVIYPIKTWIYQML